MLHPLAVSRLRLSSEPPADYVTFVERHLPALRSESADVVGSAADADRLYPNVLGDVAGWWRELELLRMLGARHAAEQYLSWAFRRRARGWRAEEEARKVSIDAFRPDETMQVWFGAADPVLGPVAEPDREPGRAELEPLRPRPVRSRPARPARSSLALRLAGAVASPVVEFGPLLEATIPWLHAYRTRQRRWLVVKFVAVVVAFVVLARLTKG